MNNETKRDVFKDVVETLHVMDGAPDDYCKDLIDQYDDALPDNLPVIPKAVATYIKKCKHDGIAIASAMDEDKFPKKVADYFRNYYTRDQWIKLQDTFARAWLDGYRVEEDDD